MEKKKDMRKKMNFKSNTKLFRNSTCLKKDLITVIDIARALLTSLRIFSVPLQTPNTSIYISVPKDAVPEGSTGWVWNP